MKKIFVLFLLGLFFASCGPKRLGCGPYRCEVKSTKTIFNDTNKLKNA